MKTAAQLHRGESAIVKSYKDMDSAMRLLEVGLLPGSRVQMMRIAPFGGPMYLKAGQSYFALRKQEAENVVVND